MSVLPDRKEHPLSLRLASADLAVIDRAAALCGRSRTQFMRDASVYAAERVLLEATPIRMSAEGFESFLSILEQPAQSVPEMVGILQRPAPWEHPS